MITIINYGMGNLRSVEKIFQRHDIPAMISSNVTEIENAEKLLLPGVGNFKNGVDKLRSNNLWEVLNKKVLVNKTPIIGICLGMQLMTKFSEEGNVNGFDWIEAITKKFPPNTNLKTPHMGWNTINIKKDNPLGADLTNESSFYFVHSYYVTCENAEDVLFETQYGIPFVSGFQKNNIYGVQFHPEKSYKAGLQLIKNFSAL